MPVFTSGFHSYTGTVSQSQEALKINNMVYIFMLLPTKVNFFIPGKVVIKTKIRVSVATI